ncbi:MAG: hypothetical protein PHP06_05905 [Clostridia bacterium]|nr:hypothetical protein [Clostridia bacterium]
MVEFTQSLGEWLVHSGALTPEQLVAAQQLEVEAGSEDLHPLYKSLNKDLSVRVPKAAESSGVDRILARREADISIARKRSVDWDKEHSKCWNDGDCESCEHNDNCPVPAEMMATVMGEDRI